MIKFQNEQSGTANFVLSNIDDNSLSKGNFIIVILSSMFENFESIPI